MKVRPNWTTRLGFYFAAIGSAFGLGNLWRFPYVVAENGGGAFVLLYVFLAFLVGVPILVAELILGKESGQSIMGALQDIERSRAIDSPSAAARPRWRWSLWIGRASVIASLVVLSYYAVISGWVLHYFMQFLIGLLRDQSVAVTQALSSLQQNGLLQVALASVHLLLTIIVVMKGVQNGIERWVGFVMPIFTVLLIVLVINSLSLPTVVTALRFLFYPDFSKLSINSLGQALGHVFFTLSIGFGIMVTFGSYMRQDSHVPEAGFRVAVLDTGISLVAGLLIFPMMMMASIVDSGPEVLFQTLPLLFQRLDGGGSWFGMAFFLCLYLAALGASIGLLEAAVSNFGDRWGMTRSKAAWTAGALALAAAVFPALSSSVLSGVQLAGRSVIEIFDMVLINWVLPLIALGLCWVVSKRVKDSSKEKEFLGSHDTASVALYGHWKMVIGWLGPLVIISALVLQWIGLWF